MTYFQYIMVQNLDYHSTITIPQGLNAGMVRKIQDQSKTKFQQYKIL